MTFETELLEVADSPSTSAVKTVWPIWTLGVTLIAESLCAVPLTM